MNDLLAGSKRPLVICDCEGGEFDLLVPEAVPELRRAVVIVEVHDYFGGDRIGQQLRERFAPTHEIEPVGVAARDRGDLPAPYSTTLSDEDAAAATSEGRPPTSGWLVLRPRA